MKKPRRRSGACSSVRELAPLCSPAADRPCRIAQEHEDHRVRRRRSRRRRARRPIAKVETPISSRVRTSIFLRPTVSPKWPMMTAPIGPGDVGDAERGQRQQRGGGGVGVREEDLREHQAGGGAVDEEVVVLEHAADEAGEGGLARDALGGGSTGGGGGASWSLLGVPAAAIWSCRVGGRAGPGAVSGAAVRCCARRPGSPAACSQSEAYVPTGYVPDGEVMAVTLSSRRPRSIPGSTTEAPEGAGGTRGTARRPPRRLRDGALEGDQDALDAAGTRPGP